MKKFIAIYRVPVETMTEWKKTTSPEEMKVQGEKLMAAMTAWTQKHQASLIGEVMAMGKNMRVTKGNVEAVSNDLNGQCIVQAESHEAACAIFADSPHFDIPTAFIDIMEIPHMGM